MHWEGGCYGKKPCGLGEMGMAVRDKRVWGSVEPWLRIQQTGLESWIYSPLAVWL